MTRQKLYSVFVFLFFVLFAYSNEPVLDFCSADAALGDVWHVKAIHPSGELLGIKAIDKNRFIYSVKAYHRGSPYVMDVKAVINGKEIAIKVLKSDDPHAPVKAIGMDGSVYDIKAIDIDKKFLDVKGVTSTGNLINIKALGQDGSFYPIKAISTAGNLMDIKGVSFEDNVNKMYNNVEIIGHVKALPQMNCASGDAEWFVKAFHPMGELMSVYAFDDEGKMYPLVAIGKAEYIQLIDVKVKIDDQLIPVKVVLDEEKYHRVKAILPDGTQLSVKAIDPYEDMLEVCAVNRQDNVLSIKAIGTSGNFYGVKAMTENGFLYDIKGIKLKVDDLEAMVNTVQVFAHVKAFPQILK